MRRHKLDHTKFFDLGKIIASMPECVYWKDTNGYYRGCNDFLLKVANFKSKEEIINKNDYQIGETLGWSEENIKKILSVDKEIMATGIPQFNVEEPPLVMGDGSIVWLRTSKVPLKDEKGKVVGIIGISINFTKQKEAENLLAEQVKIAEAASQAKSEFIANMNHDIRTPLTGMIGMAEAIVDNSQDTYIKEYAEDILKAGQRLLELANNILEAFQTEMQDIPQHPQIVNLKEISQTLKELFTPSFLNKKIDFVLNYDKNIPLHLGGYVVFVRRILMNLLSNAIKFTHKGSVSLSMKHLKIEKEKTFVTFTVSDTGIGIPESQWVSIFEPFKKLTTSYQGTYKGYGLGLHVVKQLVEKLEGHIEVQSKLGEGSTFIIIIPFLTLC